MKNAIKCFGVLTASLLLPVAAFAECERNLSPFSNNFESNPTMSAAAPGARTNEDFQVATANFFFFTPGGQDYTDSAIANPGFISVISAMWSGTFEVRSGMHGVPMCSDTGQCTQGGIVGVFGENQLADSSITIDLGNGISTTVGIDGGTEPTLQGYVVVSWDVNGNTDSTTYSLPEIEARQTVNTPFDLPSEGTADEAQDGDGCRDNEGNDVGDDTDPPVGGGDGYIPPWEPPDLWGNDPYWNLNLGRCFHCWGTPTGVACRQVALTMCG